MEQTEQPTKQDLQNEYARNVAVIGDRLYKFFHPLIEISNLLHRCLQIDNEVRKLAASEPPPKPTLAKIPE